MKRTPLYSNGEHPKLDYYLDLIHRNRFFKRVSRPVLRSIMLKGTVVTIEHEEMLITEGGGPQEELFVLTEGSLAILSRQRFILRLESPGDIVGEMSLISPAPRSADVIAESECTLISFNRDVFAVNLESDTVSIMYYLISHILVEKLRLTTAQSLIRKNERVINIDSVRVAIIDENAIDRLIVTGLLESQWPETQITEFDSPGEFIEKAIMERYDLVVTDVNYEHGMESNPQAIGNLIKAAKFHGTPVLVLSTVCNDFVMRDSLMDMGVDYLLGKPFSIFDLKHTLLKFRVWHYKQKELDHIEHDADTDRLTGLANRRRLEEVLDALVTVYPENNNPFSMIIADVDNFKHYNDTHGHQLGDVVLAGVAAILSQKLRRGDLAARFGGEEFVVVLPNCNKENAKLVAEKLRMSIANEEFPYQDQQPLGNLTVTMGVSTYPDDATNIEDLLKAADDCLYVGKDQGRNRVIVANEYD